MASQSRAVELVDVSWKACLVGLIAGLGAIAFRGLIALFHNLAFGGHLSLHYDANLHTPPSPLGPLIIAVPVVGAVVVAFLVQRFAPEAKGHGVPEVMDAIYYRAGRIRPVVAVVKALASSISIATGGSVGREGPIAQIGSAFGSTLAQWLKLPPWQRVTLIAAGAGAGIAATFNTPIGGVLFAVELLLVEVNGRTLFPVSLAVAIATLVGRAAFGAKPSFFVAQQVGEHLLVGALPLLLVFGVLIGACAALYARSIYWLEDLFDAIPGGYYLRHTLGMLLIGVTMYLFLRTAGHYYIEGVGYATLQDILDGALTTPWLLFILFVAKLLTTSVTIGSGASGGVFSPALFLGGCLGGAFAGVFHPILPLLGLRPLVLAVAGMAGVAGASMGAELTAVTMLFEMTRSYEIVLPMIVTVAAAYATRRVLMRESIYTFKLARRGDHVPQGLVAELAFVQPVWSVADHRVVRAPATASAAEIMQSDAEYFAIANDDDVHGLVSRRRLLDALAKNERLELERASEPFVWLDWREPIRRARAKVENQRSALGLIKGPDDTLAVVTPESLGLALDRTLALIEL
jgi:CIC family chloride channel protein